MPNKKWTQQEEETLNRLYEDPKVFPKSIAKMLGRTLPQVYNKARAMGLKAPMERIRMASRLGTQHPTSTATRFQKARKLKGFQNLRHSTPISAISCQKHL